MAGSIYDWSLTPSDNQTADPEIDWREGQDPSTVNDSARAMMTRFKQWLLDKGVVAVTGTNSLSATANSPFDSYQSGLQLRIKAAAANTGAVTLNANSLGGKAIRKFVRGQTGDQALASGDIQANGIYDLVYDTAANSGAGAWIIQNPASANLTAQDNTWTGTQTFNQAVISATGSGATSTAFAVSGGNFFNFDHLGDLTGQTAIYRFGRSTTADAFEIHLMNPGLSTAAIQLTTANGGRVIAGSFQGDGSLVTNVDAASVGGVSLSGLVQTSRTITAGTGLTGGGSLAANRTINVDSTVWRDDNPPTANQLAGTLSGFGASQLSSGGSVPTGSAYIRLASTSSTAAIRVRTTSTNSNDEYEGITFHNGNNSQVGSITLSGVQTSYQTSSDYRLPWKEGYSDLSGSGEFIDALKPRYFPKVSRGGFIAHEFAEVSPSSVSGEKDAVNDQGEPIYQAMEASSPEVIAHMVAEIQSLRRRVRALEGSNGE